MGPRTSQRFAGQITPPLSIADAFAHNKAPLFGIPHSFRFGAICGWGGIGDT